MEPPAAAPAPDEPSASKPKEPGPQAPESTNAQATAQLRHRVMRGGSLLVLTRWGTQIFVWAATLLIARFLTPDDYAMVGLGMMLIYLADMFVEAGMARAIIQKDTLELRDVDEAFTLSMLLGAVTYGLFFATADFAEEWFERPGFALYLRVLSLHMLLMPFLSIPLGLLDRGLSMKQQSVVHVVASVYQSVVVLVLAWLGWGYWSLVAGSLSRRLLDVVAFSWVARWRPRFAWLTQRATVLFKFGIHNSMASFLWYIYSYVDYAFVNRYDRDMLGYYVIAFQLISLPAEKLTFAVSKVAYPAFCRLQHDRPRLRDWFLRLLLLLGFLAFPTLAGLAAVAEEAFPLILGEQWRPAVLPFQVLVISGVVKVFISLFPTLYNAIGRPGLVFKMNLVNFVILPPAFFFAAYFHGMMGVCLVWAVLYPAVSFAFVHATRQTTNISVSDVLRALLWVFAGAGLMTLLVVASLYAMAGFAPVVRLALAIVVGIAVYAGTMLLFCRDTVLADLQALWRELRRPEAKATG